jgi:hypothetical protein
MIVAPATVMRIQNVIMVTVVMSAFGGAVAVSGRLRVDALLRRAARAVDRPRTVTLVARPNPNMLYDWKTESM